MPSIKKDIRTNQAHQVIQYSNQGKSIVEACQEVGISRSTFYYLTSRNPDAIASFQEMQLVAAVRQFKLILDNQIEILRRVIEEALAETTRPRQRLAIKKYLNKRLEELYETVRFYNPSSGADADFLTGPKLERGISSFESNQQGNSEMGAQES